MQRRKLIYRSTRTPKYSPTVTPDRAAWERRSAIWDGVAATTQNVDKIDKAMLDHHIGEIDRKLRSSSTIMHHANFQKMEASWRSLKFLVDRIDFKKNAKLDILDVSKDNLAEDFEDAPETIQSGLYKHVYVSEYDTPSSEPYGSIVSNFEFDSGPSDITLLQSVSKVSAACHCPFLGTASPKFFGKETIHDLPRSRTCITTWADARDSKIELFPPDRRRAFTWAQCFPGLCFAFPTGPDTPAAEGYGLPPRT